MIHLYRHNHGKNKGKYDIALVVRGKYIVGSNQGYNRKLGAIRAIKSILLCDIPRSSDSLIFQDDTLKTLPVFRLYFDGTMFSTAYKSSKPYQPQTIKK